MGMSIEDEREMRANGITNVEIKHIKQLYENRLKADMVDMLTEILTDFDNQIEPNSTRIDCESIIEQKISELEDKE